MKNVKVLGSGCKNCKVTAERVRAVAEALDVEITLEKIEDFAEIASYGIMSTPGVIIDGAIVHSGGVPTRDAIEGWLL